MKVTKKVLVEKVHNQHPHMQKEDAVKAVERFFAVSKKKLGENGKLVLSGFGTFEIREKKARRGRNPRTGETLILAERKIVMFKLSIKVRNKFKR